MASSINASAALFLSPNLVLFALVSCENVVNESSCTTNHVVIGPGDEVPKGEICNPLNLGVCHNLLNLVAVELGNIPTKQCRSLIQGLHDLEAAVCLCTAVRASVLGFNINLPIFLNLFLNKCGRKVPDQYICSLK